MRKKALFNDERLGRVYESLVKSMSESGSALINRACSTAAGRKAAYRFINNENVTVKKISEDMKQQTINNISILKCKDILVAQDTMEVVRENLLGRLKKNGRNYVETVKKQKGMRSHSALAMRADDGVPLGFLFLKIWGREPKDGKDNLPNVDRRRQPSYYIQDSETGKTKYKYNIPVENRDSESSRWIDSADEVRKCIPNDVHIIMVQDREGDMYPLLTLPLKHPNLDIVVRATKKRKVAHEGKKEGLFEYTLSTQARCAYEITVHKGNGIKARTAKVELRFGSATILRPHSPVYPTKEVKLYFVRVTEEGNASVDKDERIDWLLLTSIEVTSVDDAKNIVSYYKKRWFIEDYHRLLKKKGFGILDIQVESPNAFEVNLAVGIKSAYEVALLKKGFDASDEDDPATIVFTPLEIEIASNLNKKFNPKKKIYKNPYKYGSLAWAAWIVACEGGWSAMPSQPKPGIITFKRGLDRIEDIYTYFIRDGGATCG